MLKKVLVGAAALGLTVAALANGNSVPVVTAVPASEFNPGIYLGLQAGYGVAGWYRVKDDYSVSDDNGLAGRLLLGYDFTKYWAAEVGYTYFGGKSKLKDGASTAVSEIRTQAFDLVAKGKIPVVDKFDIYGKAGIAYLMSKGIRKAVDAGDSWVGSNDKQNNVAAVLGLGADYYFKPNLWMDLSWTKYIVGKKFGGTTSYVDNYQPDTDLFVLGLNYKFVL